MDKKKEVESEMEAPRSGYIAKFAKSLSSHVVFALIGWIICYFGLSLALGVGIAAVYALNKALYKERREHREQAQAYFKDEAAAVHAAFKEAPRWVFYPDIERAEWINKMLKLLWPDFSSYIYTYIKDSLEPLICSSLPTKINNFRFDKIDLGDAPPRVTGIKVYDMNYSDSEIILDMELSYAGDINIKASLSKFNVGVKDVQIRGTIRLILAPLLNEPPFVGGLQCFFLNVPEVNFDLTNLGGLVELPGVYDALQNIVIQSLSAYLVLPNKISFSLSDKVTIQSLRFTPPKGLLRIQLVEAANLANMDLTSLSDPFVKFIVGNETKRSTTVKDNLNPKWINEYFEFILLEEFYQNVNVSVYDEDDASNDDLLGRVDFATGDIVDCGHLDTWLTLQDGQGSVRLICTWFPASSDKQQIQKPSKDSYGLTTCMLSVYVESAKNLVSSDSKKSDVTSVVQVSVDNDVQTTQNAQTSNDPSYNECFYLLIQDPRLTYLSVNVMEGKSVIGYTTIPVSSCLKAREMSIKRPFTLKSEKVTHSEINLVLTLHALEKKRPVNPIVASASKMSHAELGSRTPSATHLPNTLLAPVETDTFHDAEDSANDDAVSIPYSIASGLSDIRWRGTSMTASRAELPVGEDHGVGKVEMTLKFIPNKQKLTIHINKCLNLPLVEQELPDPYIKLYLLPDKSNRKKTQVRKSTVNPIFGESFEFTTTKAELQTQTIELQVKCYQSMFSRPVIAKLFVIMSTINLTKSLTSWYYFEEPEQPNNCHRCVIY